VHLTHALCLQSYAFVQFEQIEDAEYAMKKTNGSELLGRTITVSAGLGTGHQARQSFLGNI
jgi:RNA recognition motif-containing protein